MKRLSSTAGFTLIEMALILVIMEVILAAALGSYLTLAEAARKATTEQRMAMIYDSLALYAQRNLRLPCPARTNFATSLQPFGAETGSGVNGGNIPAQCSLAEGLVPFATLGLDPSAVKDGWGRFFTYRIATEFGRTPRDPAYRVHENCRSRIWMEPDPQNPANSRNINPDLARFCCRAPAAAASGNIIVRHTPGPGGRRSWLLNPDSAAGRYNTADVPGPDLASNAPARNTTVPVFYVLSHGSNGVGAFDTQGTGTRMGAGSGGADENRNANTSSSTVWSLPTVTRIGATYFDDLLIWGTQDHLLARGDGLLSCLAPGRS